MADDPVKGPQEQRERLSRLSEASLRISESLDFEIVLREGAGERPGANGRHVWRGHPP